MKPKYIVLALAILLLFFGAIILAKKGNDKVSNNTNQTKPTESSLKTFSGEGLAFDYPISWVKYNTDDSSVPYPPTQYFSRFGQIVTTVATPKFENQGTNLHAAFVTFAKDTVIGNEADCAKYTDYQQSDNTANPLGYRSLEMKQTKAIGNVKYYYAEIDGAAAGTKSQTRIYHTLQHEICYEINLNLFTSDISYYEPATVTAIDEAGVWKKLEDVITTARFLDLQ